MISYLEKSIKWLNFIKDSYSNQRIFTIWIVSLDSLPDSGLRQSSPFGYTHICVSDWQQQ